MVGNKMVRNLFDELLTCVASGRPDAKHDPRFRAWAKRVERVNADLTNGYMFVGPFVKEGTVEVETRPSLFLIATVNGSRKYQRTHYTLVAMDEFGSLSLVPDAYTTSEPSGWALRMREHVLAALAALTSQPDLTEAEQALVEALSALPPERRQLVIDAVKR